MKDTGPQEAIKNMVEDALLYHRSGAEIGESAKVKKQLKLMERARALSEKLRLHESFQEAAAQTSGRVEVSQLKVICTEYCAVGYTIVVSQGADNASARGSSDNFPTIYAGSDGFLSDEAMRYPTYGFLMHTKRLFGGYNEKMLERTLRKTIMGLVEAGYIPPAARNG